LTAHVKLKPGATRPELVCDSVISPIAPPSTAPHAAANTQTIAKLHLMVRDLRNVISARQACLRALCIAPARTDRSGRQ
jgi:hypothetical protein